MQVEIKVNGAVVRLIKRSLEINSTLGKRISTVTFDYLGEEKLTPEDKYGLGYALDFDGDNDYINCGNPSFAADQQGTVEMWVYRVSAGAICLLGFTKFSTGVIDEWRLETNTNERIRINVYENTVNTLIGLSDNAVFPVNTWSYLALTSDGTTLKLYVNGVLKTINIGAGANNGQWFGDMVTDADQITIGALARGNAYLIDLEGSIAQVRISDIPRTQGEITANWNGGVGRLFPDDANTVALWNIDEGVGKITYDETANNNDGRIWGAGWVEGIIPRIIASAPSLATMDANAYGGLIYPWGKDEIKITGRYP